MSCCIFFGHRNCSDINKETIIKEITNVILNYSADKFYVGNNGDFDKLVIDSLLTIQKRFDWIKWYIVLYNLPNKPSLLYENTIYPEELEYVPKRLGIEKRNLWMINRADIVITHVTHSFGCAAKFKRISENKGKPVINI